MLSQPPLHTGLRKTSETIQHWQLFAKQHDNLSLPLGRIETVKLAKRVYKLCQLRPSTMHVFEYICLITRECDWQGDCRPLCNATLKTIAREKSLSYRTVQYAMRELVEAGWIVERLTRNSHRRTFYNLGKDAPPTDAYGVDPSIFAFRSDQFLAMAAEAERQARECDKIRRQIVHLIWNIRNLLEEALGALDDTAHIRFEERFLDLPTRSTRQDRMLSSFKGLQKLETDLLAALAAHRKQTSLLDLPGEIPAFVRAQHAKSACTIQTTSNILSVTSPSDKQPPTQTPSFDTSAEPQAGKDERCQMRPDLLDACPHFGAELTTLIKIGGDHPTERAVQDAADRLRSYVGISPSLWHDITRSGAPALEMLACTFELYELGHVANPGGFLRGLFKNSQRDRLRINDLLLRCHSLTRRKRSKHH